MKKVLKFLVTFYLKWLTRFVIAKFKPEVIVIAGTHNKTPTKEILKKILSNYFDVRANPQSYNTEIGVPLAVLGLSSGYSSVWKWVKVLAQGTIQTIFSSDFPKKLILEFGTDKPGDIKYLLSLVKPDILILTNIESEYIANFGSLDNIAKEYEDLIRTLKNDDVLIYNLDDERLAALAKITKARIISYSIEDETADWYVSNMSKSSVGQEFIVVHQGNNYFISTTRFGQHSIYSIIICLVVADLYSLAIDEVVKIID